MPEPSPSRTRFARRAVRGLLVGLVLVSAAAGLTACSAAPGAMVRVLAGEATLDGEQVSAPERVVSGDVIEVSGADAFVEIQWADGSFTRLAEGARFEVGGGGVRGTLESGTAWNAVASTSSGYEIATADGTVVARPDTSFAVSCAESCGGVVAAGTVTVGDDGTVVVAPAAFAFDDDPVTASWDAIFSDPFAVANGERDAQAGFPPAAEAWSGREPAVGSVSGFFEGPGEQLEATCTGWPEECARTESTIFQYDGTSDYTFTTSCADVLPCAVVAEFTVLSTDGVSRIVEVPLAFDGETYRMSYVFKESPYCIFPDGREEGRWINTITADLTPTSAEVRDGVFVVTEMRAELGSSVVGVEATSDPGCAQFEYEWSTRSSAVLALAESAAAPEEYLPSDVEPLRPVTGPARPSTLSDLGKPIDAVPTVDQMALIAGTILVLVLVLAYPGYLLSRVVSDRYDQITARRTPRARVRSHPGAVARRLLLVLGVVVASLITAALDPTFGSELVSAASDPGTLGPAIAAFFGNAASWRLVLTAFVSFVLFLGAGSLVVRLAGRVFAPGVPMPLQFRWGSLLILVAGVVVSRLLGITPGIIFGLVAGLVIADSIPKAAKGRLMLVSAGFAILIGIGAWIGFGVVSPAAEAAPDSVALLFTSEVLSALTIEAVSTLPLAFLPFLGLDGGTLRTWRFAVWALVYAIGLALFMIVLVTLPGSWTEIQGDIVRWLIGFVAFTVIAIAVWLVHERLKKRAEQNAHTGEPPPEDAEDEASRLTP